MVAEKAEAKRLVFVAKMDASTSLFSLYARAPKGERIRWSEPRNREPKTTLLATTSSERKDRVWQYLAALPQRLVVDNNLSAHKGERVKELIEERGRELSYLPPYSPDFIPLEEAFSKIKGILRKAEARSRTALVEVPGAAILAITAWEVRGFFEHCRYAILVQLL